MSLSIHPSAQFGFSHDANLYEQSRPHYPNAIIEWLQQELSLNKDSHVVDLGAGTGKFIPYLQQITNNICAIEPILEMLEQLKHQYPTIATRLTDSHETYLESESIDAVLCAQSFHWFANSRSLQEAARILKPKAKLGLIWNQRDTRVDWINTISDLITPLEGDTPRFYHGTWEEIFNQHPQHFELKSVKEFNFQHIGSVETVVIQRILSTSFIAASSPQQKELIRQELIQIVKHYLDKKPQDIVHFPYTTYAYHYEKL